MRRGGVGGWCGRVGDEVAVVVVVVVVEDEEEKAEREERWEDGGEERERERERVDARRRGVEWEVPMVGMGRWVSSLRDAC
jgi:uncharacterized protein YraI